MRVQCPQCGTGGNIPDEKIPAKGTNIVCPKCKASFFVSPPHEAGLSVSSPLIENDEAANYYQAGVQLLKTRQIDAAIEKFTVALQLRPEYQEAFRYLGLAYGQKHLWKEATQALEKAVAFQPDDLLSLKNLGIAYLHQKEFDQAERTLQQALQSATHDEKTQAYLEMAIRGRQQPVETPTAASTAQESGIEATRVADNVGAARRDPVQNLLDKGVEYLDNAQYNKAIEAFQEVIRLTPASSDGYVGLGMVHEKRQDWKNATEIYQKALEINPDDVVARENLRFVKKQRKKFRFPRWKK